MRVDEPRVLKDGANLVLHLAPAPVVARIAMRMAELRPDVRRRELDTTLWLLERGLAVSPPADELPAAVHERDGFAITFWKLLREGEPDPVEAGRALRAIDEALRGYDGAVAGFWPVYESRALADRLGLPPVVLETIDRVEAELEYEPVALHGDAHRRNCFEGPLWGDFEDACLAPPEWEHACLTLPIMLDGDDWHPRVLAQLPEPDPGRLELLVLLRATMAITWGWFVHGPNERVLERLGWLEAHA